MWKSPIELIESDIETKLEDAVFEAVQSVGIRVDKDELLKALAYDREQYEKGYADGLKDAHPERKRGKWIEEGRWSEGCGMGETYGCYWRCSSCDKIMQGDYYQCGANFCPNCGADMRGEEDATLH